MSLLGQPNETKIRVTFICNTGGNDVGHVDVPEGTTVGELLQIKVPGAAVDRFTLRVNRQDATPDTVLTQGARVSATPSNVKGA